MSDNQGFNYSDILEKIPAIKTANNIVAQGQVLENELKVMRKNPSKALENEILPMGRESGILQHNVLERIPVMKTTNKIIEQGKALENEIKEISKNPSKIFNNDTLRMINNPSKAIKNGILPMGKEPVINIEDMINKMAVVKSARAIVEQGKALENEITEMIKDPEKVLKDGILGVNKSNMPILNATAGITGMGIMSKSKINEQGIIPKSENIEIAEDYVYTYGDILVEPYCFEKILDLKITREINEHGKLLISGIISEENEDKYVECADEQSTIKLAVIDDKQNTTDIFYGIVTNIAISTKSNVKKLEIEALGNTFLMDIRKKSRTFQNQSFTYENIFKIINSNYNKVQISDEVTKGKKIDKLIVQYKETDWELIKRLSSHFNAGVISECQLENINYSIGQSGYNKNYDLKEFNYSIKKNLQEYRVKSENEDYDLNDINLVTYEVISTKIMSLGNVVKFKERNLYVYKCEIEIVDGQLINKYKLRDEKGMKIIKTFNEKLVGASLNGKILDTKNDVVKIDLEIDDEKNNSEAKWFPYSTVFSSADGTGWYCMPEVGDAIRLYFPDNEEKNAYAISSVNLKSSNSKKRSDPSVKSIGTKYGKEVVMKNGAVEIIGNGNLLMRLTDDGGIEVKSNKKIILDAKEDIEITGGTKISMQGKEGIALTQASANMQIKDNVTMSGGKVNIE